MAFKIVNINLINMKVALSSEFVDFDENGVGEIKSEEVYNEALKLGNFFPYNEETGEADEDSDEADSGEDENEVENSVENSEDDAEENQEPKDEKKAENDLKQAKESWGHDELDKYAEELGIRGNDDYPEDETKAIKVAYINAEVTERSKEDTEDNE